MDNIPVSRCQSCHQLSAGDGLQSPVGRWPELARDEGIEICVEKAVDFYQNVVISAVDS